MSLTLLADNWIALSLLASLIGAVMIQANHTFQLQGPVLILVRSAFASLLLLPVVLTVTWPQNQLFYVMTGGIALALFMADAVVFAAARGFGGRMASIFLPMKIIFGFIAWCLVDPGFVKALMQHPLHAAGVVGCLLLGGGGMLVMRASENGWRAFMFMLPCGLAFALSDTLVKLALRGQDLAAAVMVLTFLVNVVHVPVAMAWLARNGGMKTLTLPRRQTLLLAGGVMGLLAVAMLGSMNSAFSLSPNPAYVNALGLLSIVWLSLYHRIRGYQDDVSIWSMAVFVLSALGIILLVGSQQG